MKFDITFRSLSLDELNLIHKIFNNIKKKRDENKDISDIENIFKDDYI